MRTTLVTLVLLTGFILTSKAQKIDQKFIDAHTYYNLKDALENPDKVYALQLTRPRKAFPMEVFKFPNLRSLRVFRIKINAIPPQIGQLKHLEKLFLSNSPSLTVMLTSPPAQNKKFLRITFCVPKFYFHSERPQSINFPTNYLHM